MEKITTIGILSLIDYIKMMSVANPYIHPQIEIVDKNKMREFLLFCENISDYSYVDKLGGDTGVRRKRTDLKLSDIVHKADTSIACGLKVVLKPLMQLMEWERWDDGYIEAFARMDSDLETSMEWFNWQYIKVSHLEIILKTYKEDLYLL